MGIRQIRLGDEIRDVLARCFMGHQLEDPRLGGVVITHVKLTGDLQLATVYFRIIDEEATTQEQVLKGLDSCKGFLKKILASEIKLRRVPELRFLFDTSIEYGSLIEGLISKTKA